MIETTQRCSICKKDSCDGKEYIVPAHTGIYGCQEIKRVVCSSQVRKIGDKYFHHVIYGHGVDYMIEVTEKMG